MKDWIRVVLFLLVTLKLCESNRTLEIFFTSYSDRNSQECVQDCSSRITVCLQRINERRRSCSIDKETFNVTSNKINFDRDGVIGTYNSTDITNPLQFSFNETVFQIVIRIENERDPQTYRFSGNTSDDTQSNSRRLQFGRRGIRVELSYTFSCSINFYGSNCSINCINTDDDTGHFKCDEKGTMLCLPGYANASPSDRRCTKCVSDACTGMKVEQGRFERSFQNITTESNKSNDTQNSGLSSGGVAGIVIAVVFILAFVVAGVIGGLLLVIYRPWSDEFNQKRARSQSNSKALNNPVYETETFNPPVRGSGTVAKIGADGAADLRDQPPRAHAKLAPVESNPLYSSKDSIAGGSNANMDESTFVDNKSLVHVLDKQEPFNNPIPTQAQENSKGSVPLVNPNARHTDGLPPHTSEATDAECPQDFVPQFDDKTYEDVSPINVE